jgi:hypothetical protein
MEEHEMNGFWNMINAIGGSIQGLFGGLLIMLCGAGSLTLAVVLSIHKIRKPFAVVLQTVACCILMMPIMWGLNNYVGAKASTMHVSYKPDEKDRKIAELENTIRHLESTGFNLQEFKKILELGLIETTLKQTALTKNTFDYTHRGILPSSNYDWEYLGVLTSNLQASFGVDLNTIKLYNSSADTVMVYGIKSKFLGTRNFTSTVEVSEVRKLMTNSNGHYSADIQIDNSRPAIIALRKQENTMESNYRNRLNQGLETGFMDDTVKKLAENFVKMILAPLDKNIVFTDYDSPDSLHLTIFLEQVKKEKEEELAILLTEKAP